MHSLFWRWFYNSSPTYLTQITCTCLSQRIPAKRIVYLLYAVNTYEQGNQYLRKLVKRLDLKTVQSLIIQLFEWIMSSSILHYGQVIRIRSYQKANTFLTSKSYTDPNLYFQIYNKDNLLPSGTNDCININNYRESLFQVLPTSSFEINDEMNSQKVEAKKAESKPRAKTEEEQFKAIITEKRGKNISFGDKVIFRHVDSQYYINGSFDCASSGIGAFKIELKKQLSQKIIFQLIAYRTYEKDGDQMSIYAPFKIYHCETQCYLSYCYEELFLDKVHEEVINRGRLARDDVNFPIDPPMLKESFKVRDQQQGDDNQGNGGTKGEVMLKIGRYLMINQNIPKRVFKLVTHNEFEMKINRQQIKNHDIVYFIHTEKDQYICPDNFGTQIFLKKRLDEPDQSDIFDGLWEIEEIKTIQDKTQDVSNINRSKSPSKKDTKDQLKKFGNVLTPNNLNATFLKATVGNPLEEGAVGVGSAQNSSDNQDDGQKGAKKKEKYILRHLASGRIMYVSEVQRGIQLQNDQSGIRRPLLLLEAVDTKLEDGSLVQFTFKRRKNQKQTTKMFLSTIKANEEQKKSVVAGGDALLQVEEHLQEGQSIMQENNSGQDNPLYRAYNSRFEINNLGLVSQSSEHGFRIYKINQEVKQLCLFVLSSQQIISKFTSLINSYRTLEDLLQELTVFLLNNVIGVFKSLIGFIYDCDFNIIAESGNNPNSKKQRIFDEVGMIELTTRMLEIIHKRDFEEGEYLNLLEKQNKNSQYRKIRTCYELGYKLLESIAAGNDLLKVKISRYLNKYLYQIIQKANRSVYKSIQEVLEGNQLALEEIKEDYIQKLIQNLDQNDPDPADLYFLSRLCLCRQRTVHNNQIAVFKYFYEEDVPEIKTLINKFKVQEKLAANKFKFREDQQKMQILSIIIPHNEPQYRTLSELFQECQLMKSEGGYNPDKNHWAYFMQYLNLLADLCVQRNPIPLSYIINNLPLKTLVAFLYEATVKKNLLFQPFIRLVHHAFVENSDYEEISRITKVKDWTELGKLQIPKAKRPIPQDIKKTMALIIDYIKRINKKSYQELKLQQQERQKKKQSNQIKNNEDQSVQHQPDNISLDVDDKNRLTNVKTFLEILKSTLNLGFWPQINEMKQIVPYLLKVLRFDIEYADRALDIQKQEDTANHDMRTAFTETEYKQYVYGKIKQQLKLNKPNIVLLVQCKILAAKIMNILIDYQFNVRVSIITKHFKDVMEADVDLSKYVYDKIQFVKKWSTHTEFDLFAPANKKEGYLLIEQLWMDKVDDILNTRDLFSECHAQKINPKLVFFQAFIYSNQQLTNLTLQLINRITNQRQEILKTFKDIIFVAGGVLSTLAIKGVQSTRSMLLNLTNPTIRQPQPANNEVLWNPVTEAEMKANRKLKSGVIQQLASLTMSMMKKGNPVYDVLNFYSVNDLYPFYDTMRYPGKKLMEQDIDGSFMIITEKDRNLPLNQNLIKSQDHHLIIVKFLQNMRSVPTNFDLSMRALHASYNFLTVLIWNNNQNKKQLESILKIAEAHLQFNVGCIDFFKQMYTNNKKLVKKGDIKSTIEKIIYFANQLSIKKYQKSKLLDFLRIAVIFDDKGYDINQNMVMEIISQYQVSSNNKIVYLAAQEEISERFSAKIKSGYEEWMKEYVVNYTNSRRQYCDLNVPPQLFYVATFFQIFSALIENQNVVNIGKASNMHPLDFLLKILDESYLCWIVIRHLRSYLNKLYYFEKRVRDGKLFEVFIFVDIPIIKQQLSQIAELICNTTDYYMIKIKNPIRYSYLGSYVYLTLEQILHSLDLFIKQDKVFENYLAGVIAQHAKKQQVVYNIIEIIEYLEYLLKTIDGRYINKYMSKVSKRLRSFVSNIPYDEAYKYSQDSKKKIAKNINDNDLSGDDIPFKKSYLFHDGKGFWRHLIDWNSFKQQEIQREKQLNKVSKRVEQLPNQTMETFQGRRRDYLMDLIFLGNIDKRLQKKKEGKPFPKQQIKQIKQDNKKTQTSLPKNLTTSQSARFDVKQQKFSTHDQKNIVINNRRKKLVKFIQINQAFKEYSQSQIKQHLYDIFAILRDISAERYGFAPQQKVQIVGCQQVIQSIVKMNQLDSNSIKSEYKLLIIRLLINYIQRTSDIFTMDIQNWIVNDTQKQKINQAQNFLHGCGVASFLSSLIINDLKLSIQMGNAILMLGISLLMGRSRLIQNQLFDLIKNDENNLLLCQISLLIKDCGSSIANHTIRGEMKDYSGKSMNYSDTYDYYIDTEKIMMRQFQYQPETVLEQKQFDQKVINMQYAFIFLKNLCENNIEIKNYIHEQVIVDEQDKIKAQSVDFLNLSIIELKRMFTNFNIDIIKVPFALIDFIYEVTQIPCLKNQLFVCKSSLFSDFAQLEIQISLMIQQNQLKPDEQNLLTIFNLYSSNIKNVISCLEGNTEQIYQNMSSSVLCGYFVKVLAFYIKHLPTIERVEPIITGQDLENLLNRKQLHQNYYMDMFQTTSVIVKLQKKTPVKQFKDRINFHIKNNKMEEIIFLLRKNLLGIEIKVDEMDDPYQTLFFPKHNVFRYISRTTRTNIMEEVDRSTQRDKIIGLISSKAHITQQIQYNYYLDNNFKIFNIPLSITTTKIETYMNRGLTMASVICLLMAYFAAVVYYPYSQTIQYDLGNEELLLKIASIIQFILAMTYFSLWIKSHMKLAVQKYQRMKNEVEEGEEVETPLMSLLFKIPGCKNIYCLKEDGEFGNMVLFMFGSLMGMFYSIEWYSLLLMNLLMARLEVLKNIITALKVSFKMLGILSFFGVSFITFFSVFSMSQYAETIYPDRYPDQHCQSVFDCVVQLYIKEQIGEDMEVFKPGRFMWDMIYVVFMDMLFGNILSGVLIDNFASLRAEREEMLKDKTEKCFICGIDRQALEKKSEDLKTHYTQQYHKLWNYVFYLYYLQKQTKKTGLQAIIIEKSIAEDVSWIPVATTEENNMGDLLAELENLIKEQKLSVEALPTKD